MDSTGGYGTIVFSYCGAVSIVGVVVVVSSSVVRGGGSSDLGSVSLMLLLIGSVLVGREVHVLHSGNEGILAMTPILTSFFE